MSANDKNFVGSIPEIYDTHLVPLIFEHYAEDIASRTAAGKPMAVLETAAGSGVLTRALASKLDKACCFTATDLNQPMLDRAQSQQNDPERIEWQQADALELPYADGSFDVVCCQFGVMFFPDKLAGYREAQRVLHPGGRFLFNTWDDISENVFADLVTKAAGEIFADDPPEFLARTPHGYYDTEKITQALLQAGFSDVVSETVATLSKAPSPDWPAIAYCQGTPLRNEIISRDPESLEAVTAAAATLIAQSHGNGAVEGKIQGQVFVASK